MAFFMVNPFLVAISGFPALPLCAELQHWVIQASQALRLSPEHEEFRELPQPRVLQQLPALPRFQGIPQYPEFPPVRGESSLRAL